MADQFAKPQVYAYPLMRLITSVLFFVLALQLHAQLPGIELSTSSKRAARHYQKAESAYLAGNFERAAQWLEKATQVDSEFVEAWLLAGDVYAEMDKNLQAREAFKNAIRIDAELFTPAHYIVARLAWEAKEYGEAVEYAQRFLSFGSTNADIVSKAIDVRDRARFAQVALANPVPFEPVNLGPSINDTADAYINAIRLDDSLLFFTRRFKPDDFNRHGRYSENFFVSKRTHEGWSAANQMITDWPHTHHIGAISISANGRTMFFAACGWPEGKGSCDLYISQFKNGKWNSPYNLGSAINTAQWESQPAISADGSELYFASQRSGGQGGSDIWMSLKLDDGTWSKPMNLGKTINTSGNEMAPYIHPDGQTLYFSSNGHIGMGGLDLFISRKDAAGRWQQAENLGYPINTPDDEINIILNTRGDKAYMSATRDEGFGGFDIYVFDMPQHLQPAPVSYLLALVSDKQNGKPLQADFTLIDLRSDEKVHTGVSNLPEGSILVSLPPGKDFALHIENPAYLFYSEHFRMTETTEGKPFLIEAALQPLEAGSSIVLRNVFFDTDKDVIASVSSIEMNRVADLLLKHPGLVVELGGHTDNTGSDEYNRDLSYRRALAVQKYLVKMGIDRDRLKVKGYGSEKPIADNQTEAGKALNRRTEMIIIENLPR
jgi:outer membrane protein OmpA-like peptidoglycan-associated protein/tetratricopeptide (TPR) repeat protein